MTRTRTLLAAGLAAAMMICFAHTAQAQTSPEQLYQQGQQRMAQKRPDYADGLFYRAIALAKRLGSKPKPKYLVAHCKSLVLQKKWRKPWVCSQAVKVAKGALAAELAPFAKRMTLAVTMAAAQDHAKWAAQHLEGKRYEQAVDRFRKAVKLYPAAEHRLGLCDALAKTKQLDAAIAACKYVLKANKKNKYGVMAKTRLAALAKAKAYMLKPAQQVLAKKFYKATMMMTRVSPRNRRHHETNDEHVAACLATAKAALAAGISPSRPLLVAKFGALKTKQVRATRDGHDKGWHHFATIPAVVKQCRVIAAIVLKANQ